MSTPHEYAERRVQITGEYSRASEQLETILLQKAELWLKIRERVKSDNQADKEWDRTPLGIEELVLRMKMKRYEKQLSSLRTMLEVLSQEARNII